MKRKDFTELQRNIEKYYNSFLRQDKSSIDLKEDYSTMSFLSDMTGRWFSIRIENDFDGVKIKVTNKEPDILLEDPETRDVLNQISEYFLEAEAKTSSNLVTFEIDGHEFMNMDAWLNSIDTGDFDPNKMYFVKP